MLSAICSNLQTDVFSQTCQAPKQNVSLLITNKDLFAMLWQVFTVGTLSD
jgi:hypothetical protein